MKSRIPAERITHPCGCRTVQAYGKSTHILAGACKRFPGCLVGKDLTPIQHYDLQKRILTKAG